MKYHPYRNTDPFKIPKLADKLLNEYWVIAEGLGIQTFLLYGVCLGFVRDGGYIEGDNDIDVGILGDFEKLNIELVKNGFIRKRAWEINAHFIRYNILFDVFFKFRDERFFQSFDKVKYKGRDFNIPHPIEEYLKAGYGDWKTVRHRKTWNG